MALAGRPEADPLALTVLNDNSLFAISPDEDYVNEPNESRQRDLPADSRRLVIGYLARWPCFRTPVDKAV